MDMGINQFIFLLLIGFMLTSCESEYSQVVKREAKSGVIHEDLIFGMKMGQTLTDFYDRCWQLNKEQIISEGPGNQFARYVMVLDSTSQNAEKVEMLFYGIFDREKIMRGMHMKMSYLKWSPWTTEYHAEPLMDNLRKKYMKEYSGNPFIEIEIDSTKKAFVKVDGNRQILMYPLSKKDVTVKVEDLRHTLLSTEKNR